MDELARLCQEDDDTETLPPSNVVVDDKKQQNDVDDNAVPTLIATTLSPLRLRSLEQQYSTSKGSHLKNRVKFLIHMCNTHYLLLTENHQKLIDQITSKGATHDSDNFPFQALDKELFGLFGEYLVNHARKKQDSSNEELKYGTLVNYFSGVKTWFTEQHPEYSLRDHPVCFT